ncbi:MAG: hypothetical protein DRN81_06950, partial [Thermoproteota archaeon]
TGLWNLVVTLPTGEQDSLANAFEIFGVRGKGYLLQNITIEAGESQEYGIEVPETHNLFITLQKTTLIGYGYSWSGKLSLLKNGTVIASTRGHGLHDLILHIVDPEPGFYAIKIEAYQSGSGILTVSTSLPELPLGEWVVGTIYTSCGSVWYQVEVPPNQDTLRFEAEGMGWGSHFDIYYEKYGSSDHWVSPYGPRTSIEIPNPKPGTYIVEFMDSAMIWEGDVWSGRWAKDQTRDVLIKADTKVSYEPPPDYLPTITSISPDRGGNAGFVTVEIKGGWLDPNATVSLVRSGYEDIIAQNVYGSDEKTKLIATFNLMGKEPGEWNLVVTNPDGRNATAPTSFTIEEGGKPELWVEIVGREKVRVGRGQTYIIRCGNSGNIDYRDLVVNNYLSSEVEYIYSGGNYNKESHIITWMLDNLPPGSTKYFEVKSFIPLVSTDTYIVNIVSIPKEKMYVEVDPNVVVDPDIIVDTPEYLEVIIHTRGISDSADIHFNVSFMSTEEEIEPHFEYTKDLDNVTVKGEFTLKFSPLKKVKIWIEYSEDALEKVEKAKDCIDVTLWALEKDRFLKWIWNHGYINRDVYDGLKGNLWLRYFLKIFSKFGIFGKTTIGDEGGKLLIKGLDGLSESIIDRKLKEYYLLCMNEPNAEGCENLPQDFIMDDQFCLTRCLLKKYLDDKSHAVDVIEQMSVYSTTPEDKYGPTGFDIPDTPLEERKRFIPPDKNLYYRVDFWNKENATAPACDVFVTDQLDPNLDWSTFRFEEIGFLNWTVKLEPSQYFNIYVDTRPEMN